MATMGDYPDPDEEYELMYADDLELLRETDEDHSEINVVKKQTQAKRSLDFSTPNLNNETKEFSPTNCDIALATVSNETSTNIVSPSTEFSYVNSSNKRAVDELFGDINDLDFDDVLLPSKRQKTDEEVDLELINKILEGRRLRQILSEPNRSTVLNERKTNYDYKENLSLNIPRWAFIPLTNSEGDRIYVRLESEETWEWYLDRISPPHTLHTSYDDAWNEAKKILEKQTEQENEQNVTEPLPSVDGHTEGDCGLLWVDRYRPLSYVDLLSEEPVNRAVLHWLHLWDKIVFNKEVKVIEPQQRNSFSKRMGKFQLTDKWKGKKADDVPELDEDGRPHHKVALLCGPPGVGKTTLAHLLARLAGYRPVELNASDERSVDAFRTALQNATLMRSVLDAEKRPNCLILDEIDGAPLPTVELLVRWCTASAAETGGGKKKNKTQPLKRPIIAICNDLYASALRPLRAVSLIVHVGGVSTSRLAARLARVADREGLAAPPHVLAALARRAKGDVRAALSVLHFIKMRARQLRMEDVMNSSIGEKDCHKSLMQALQAIFTVNDAPDAWNTVLKTISAAGEYDRLADGIFENYLTARVDAHLLVASETLDWLLLHDVISTWIARNQNYSIYSMLPICLTRCHRLLATRSPQYIRYPMQAQEVYRKSSELDGILWSVARSAAPSVRPSRRALLLDILSLLPYILAPTLRSANVQLCSENEKKMLHNAASVMCDYGLEYVQQRGHDGLYSFVLEPDIYKLAFFGTEERARAPPSVRQAIAREHQLEQIRRNDIQTARVQSTCKPKPEAPKEDTALPNHLQRLCPKDIVRAPAKPQRDFFGRLVSGCAPSAKTECSRDVISNSGVFYQYREGFNNAVRRSVRIKDLL